MNFIIVEDERPAARQLERKLAKLGYKVETMLHSVEEAVVWFQENQAPDLIFLDIQLSDGLSFEIFEEVEVKSAVIFTTAYDEYALRAFKLNSIDYLLKPIQDEELNMAIQKFLEQRHAFFEFSEQFNIFSKFISQKDEKQYKERFVVRIGTQMKIVHTNEIVGFLSENKTTYIRTKSLRDYIIDMSLEQIEEELDPHCFFRISRKYIVAMDAIKEIHVFSNARLKLNLIGKQEEEEWLVSRERVGAFKQWIE